LRRGTKDKRTRATVAAVSSILLLHVLSACGEALPLTREAELEATIAALQAENGRVSGGSGQASETPDTEGARRNTEKGALLEVGEAWREDDFVLRLVLAETTIAYGNGPTGPGVKLIFELTNESDHNLPIEYSQENFRAADNLGNRLEFGQAHTNGYFRPITAQEAMLVTNTIFRIPQGTRREFLFVNCDIADPLITDVLITVRELGRISEAAFTVMIPH